MVETVSCANAPLDIIQNLLCVYQTSFPEQGIDWDRVLDVLADPVEHHTPAARELTFRFLAREGLLVRVNAIGVKQWRNNLERELTRERADLISINELEYKVFNRFAFLVQTRNSLEYHEEEYRKLKESTSIIELALWKAKINEENLTQQSSSQGEKPRKKKVKMDKSGFRQRCRIMCGTSIIVENVLPFLVRSAYPLLDFPRHGTESSPGKGN